jgi:hypothetical protein
VERLLQPRQGDKGYDEAEYAGYEGAGLDPEILAGKLEEHGDGLPPVISTSGNVRGNLRFPLDKTYQTLLHVKQHLHYCHAVVNKAVL